MSEPYKVRINPRWENAPYERQFMVHNPTNTELFGMAVDLKTGWVKEPYPHRYETPEDASAMKNPVPFFIKVFPDGREEESF